MSLTTEQRMARLARNSRLLREMEEKQSYESSLIAYATYVWPIIEPAIPFVRGWAIDAIAEHLEGVSHGYIRKLLMNVPPGFTKPVSDETLVDMGDGTRKPIKDVIVGDLVITKEGRPRRVAAVYIQGTIEAVTVTSNSGRVVTAGLGHPFLTADGWVRAEELTTEHVLAVRGPRHMTPKGGRSDAEFLLAGYLIGDGCVVAGNCSITSATPANIAQVVGAATSLGFHANVTSRKKAGLYVIGLSKGARAWCRDIGIAGANSYTKRVPAFVFSAPIEQAALYLAAYFQCDGLVTAKSADRKRLMISFSSVSRDLLSDTQALLARFGINGRLRKRVLAKDNGFVKAGYVSWTLDIGQEDEAAKFFQRIPVIGPKHGRLVGHAPHRRQFFEDLLPDPVVSVEPAGNVSCRCLTVEEDSSFLAEGLIVHNSLLTDVLWPSWEWGPLNKPWLRYVCASYSNHLTERDNMRCRNIVISDRYKKMWGDRFKISNEQFTKIKFANDKTGWKLATSVGGIGVGERGDRFIIDDPNNTMDMESEIVRATTNMWFTEVVPDRLNNPRESAIVVIQQRLHEDDVSGVAIAREMGYTHLMIPMRHDTGRHCVTVIGNETWEDPRTEDGELAWPERFPDDVCDQLESDKGPYAWAGQYQQTPEPRGGSIIKREFWQLWKEERFPPFSYLLASFDGAYTAKEENDACAMTIWGCFSDAAGNPKVMLVYAWQDRLEFHDSITRIIDTCTDDQRPIDHPRFKVDRLLIEAKATGMSVAQELHRIIGFSGQFGIELVNPTKFGDKIARVHSVQHVFSEGLIYAPDRAYADMVINQCAVFPKSSRDDLVDTTSQAIRYLRDQGFALRREEHAADVAEELRYRSNPAPLYPC